MTVLPPEDKMSKQKKHSFQLPYFTVRGWIAVLILIVLFVGCMMAGVELHDFLMGR